MNLARWHRFGLGGAAALVLLGACRVDPPTSANTFELKGMHLELGCADCHDPALELGPLPTDCASCHIEDRDEVPATQVLHAGVADVPCEECHTEDGWPVEHDTYLPLRNSHFTVCLNCHAPDTFEGLAADCTACHEADRPTPDHNAGQDCAQCHVDTTWDEVINVDHSFFPLDSSHDVDCQSCHNPGGFTGLQTNCSFCHEEDRDTLDHHPGQECSLCHVITTWADAVDHTFFPLVQSHSTECIDCHQNLPDTSGNSSECSFCHETERPAVHYQPVECDSCHVTPSSWLGGLLDHSFFQLDAAHDQTCDTCHTAIPNFGGLEGACSACHEGERPGLPHNADQECSNCHAPTTWGDVSTIDHSFFPLTQSHAVDCLLCHPNAPTDYSGNSQDCSSCHESDRLTPTHFVGRECDECHTPTTWIDGFDVDHSFFALQVNHDRPCESCHTIIPVFTGLTGACSQCHDGDRPAVDHFPGQECGVCHNAGGWWDVATINHDFFDITGNHDQPCETCHLSAPATYGGLSPLCASCHEGDRLSPTHFVGQECGGCHSVTAWADVQSITHDFFPLTGNHNHGCTVCHVDAPNTYAGLSQECASCHQSDSPGCHFTGESCANCHDYSGSWLGTATAINHASRFIFPVPHRTADQCDECHETPNSQCDFNCLSCHPNEASHHSDVNGFQNNSQTCIMSGCHPDGRN